jgi:hypothetical protein
MSSHNLLSLLETSFAYKTNKGQRLNDYSQSNVVISIKYLEFLRKNPWMKKLKKKSKK